MPAISLALATMAGLSDSTRMEVFKYSAVSFGCGAPRFTSFAGSGAAARMVTSDFPPPRVW